MISTTKIFLSTLFFLVLYTSSSAQDIVQKEKTLRKVFDDVVNAYGNAKAPPQLVLLANSQKQRVLARYFPSPVPVIKIDEKIVDICKELGPDSLNALAFLLGHELAHYYAEHPWCSDYAFALGNSSLGEILRKVSVESKVEKESYADSKGLFYASVAGYRPFAVFSLLIDKIYKAYKLRSNIQGYPSKESRKQICRIELHRIQTIYPLFTDGMAALKNRRYETAIYKFNRLIQDFPSREMYNNAGAAAFLYALQLKPLQAKEFIYPVEADSITRLNPSVRGQEEYQERKYNELLNTAKKHFEKAVSLDPVYLVAKINLASLYDVMGNPDAAIGLLNQIKDSDTATRATVVMLKAIAYYHADNENRMKDMLAVWEKDYKDYYIYNYKLLKE